MRNDPMPLLLKDMPPERANRMVLHPLHQEAITTVGELISVLRQCTNRSD